MEDITLEEGTAAPLFLGRLLALLPFLRSLALPSAQLNDRGLKALVEAWMDGWRGGGTEGGREGHVMEEVDVSDNLLEEEESLGVLLSCFPNMQVGR